MVLKMNKKLLVIIITIIIFLVVLSFSGCIIRERRTGVWTDGAWQDHGRTNLQGHYWPYNYSDPKPNRNLWRDPEFALDTSYHENWEDYERHIPGYFTYSGNLIIDNPISGYYEAGTYHCRAVAYYIPEGKWYQGEDVIFTVG
jgi:hypothetical protein